MNKYTNLINEVKDIVTKLDECILKFENLINTEQRIMKIQNKRIEKTKREEINLKQEISDKNNLNQLMNYEIYGQNPPITTYLKCLLPKKFDRIFSIIMLVFLYCLYILFSQIDVVFAFITTLTFALSGIYYYEQGINERKEKLNNTNKASVKSKIDLVNVKTLDINKRIDLCKSEINDYNRNIEKLREKRKQCMELINYIKSVQSHMDDITQLEIIESINDIKNDINNNKECTKLLKH